MDLIVPDWPAPGNVHAFMTTRSAGASTGSYAGLNLGDHTGDDAGAVAQQHRQAVRGQHGADHARLPRHGSIRGP